MKKLIMATAASAVVATGALADAHSTEVKIGVILGFTGPLESITPAMGAGADLAIAEVNAAGGLLDGASVTAIRADSTCIDSAAATAAAERLITSDGITAIMGADCSGVTGAILQNVARPNGVVMISPSATSPGLTSAEDDGLFFRVAPSDARQGEVLATVLSERGIESIAISYTNNDYGKGLADSIQAAFEATGGTVTLVSAHEDGKGDYSAEVGALASAGGDALVVAGYVDQGGKGIIESSLDSGAFDIFVLPDGMYGQALLDEVGADMGGSFGLLPGSDSAGAATFAEIATAADLDPTSVYLGESYDSAALLMLAMQSAGSSASADFASHVMTVANAPGEPIGPGELAKGLEILANGGEIDYVGATAVELIGPGEASGAFREYTIEDGAYDFVGFR
ncbi:ABC transporter substrate-binding protein [Flavimaricola marinus]|uniref:Leucine-specific-binding protein n=1 Tax=Flavimaricola marinus TaxID=1819565 RepID=A0A238LCX3_9RHOB|nr:ABC transporter substrate-binding protein [Flavimaricola marinus]SMY07403.1 Leucine-specific-binding protein precursor [Flavimaricola marinus]